MKAFIVNNVNNRSFQIEKDTREDLDAFISYQMSKSKCPWGDLEKELTVKPDEYPERAIYVEDVIVQEPMFDEEFLPVLENGDQILDENEDPVLDEEGNPTFEQVQVFEEIILHRVRIPQEFTITIDELPEDMSTVWQEKMQKDIENILDKTDWLFVSDVIIPVKYRESYVTYRAQIRDQHNRELSLFSGEESYMVEDFDNFLRRTKPEEFLEGGDGESMINKFKAKL